jgi:organic hydroperoxide reductase OsmC/OhrA
MPASQMDSEQTSRELGGRGNLVLAGSGWGPTMKIAARVSNTVSAHTLEVETDGRKPSIAIAPKSAGRGSSVNGGELLFAALATCFCNDLYREAAKRSIEVQDMHARRGQGDVRESRRASTQHHLARARGCGRPSRDN